MSHRFSLEGCIFVGSVDTVNIIFKLGVVVFYGQQRGETQPISYQFKGSSLFGIF